MKTPLLWALVPMVALSSDLASASAYREVGDAPFLPAQPTMGTGPLEKIHGVLSSDLDVDVYAIFIFDPVAFSATVERGAAFDTQLFLFDSSVRGFSHDDDIPPGGIFQSTLGAINPPGPGTYFLAISEFNRDPISSPGLIWMSEPVNIERPPDGPGGPMPLVSWTGVGEGDGGEYWIQLTGCLPADQSGPQPGVWNESPDATDLYPGQETTGTGDLNWVYGELTDTLDVDNYCIDVFNPVGFSAEILGAAPPGFDSQLFLFTGSGGGVTFNDDHPDSLTSYSRITGMFVPGPGSYVLSVSHYNRKPAVTGPLPMWMDQPFAMERLPDGPGGAGPLGAWIGSGDSTGCYAVALTGAGFCATPTAITPGMRPRTLAIDAFPNPFNPSVRIECTLPEPGHVVLTVYDAAGRRVRTLFDENQSEPRLAVTWDGRNARGVQAATGIYFVRVESTHQMKTIKITLLK